MKNKQKKSIRLNLNLLFFAAAVFLMSSCSKSSDNFSSENAQTASNESAQESTTDETEDLATSALSSGSSASGRLATLSDDRFCNTPVFTDVSEDSTSGTVTIDFGNGCTDGRKNLRKGKIIVEWDGAKWFQKGSSHTITFIGYSINGVEITGTRTVMCTDFTITSAKVFSVTWTVTAYDTLTWPDKTTATRFVDKTKKWDHTATDGTLTVTDGPSSIIAASGTNRHGKVYTMTITSPLVYVGSCVKSSKVYIPSSGVKVITDVAKAKTLTIDFGTGACDDSFTVTVDKASKTLNAKNDSSND